MTNDKKILGVSTIAVIALILIAVASTYAFFKGTEAGDGDTPLEVTTNTTDSLVFNVDTDITMVADMSNFTEGKGNREGVSNATATLKANNKTNSATGNYYLYFDIKENELKYTTESKTAELLLQVSGPDGLVTSINGLNYVTVTDGKGESISGFDITEVQNLITILSNKEITTTSEKVDTWEIKVVLVNLSTDQSSNGGKKFNGEIIIQKEKYKFPLFAEYIKTKVYTGIQGENNIYYHKNLANSTEDGSYRYAGSYETVNNYVCFGSDEEECPWDNMYRIIGVFDNNVKLIKADFAKVSELGTNGTYDKYYAEGSLNGTNKGKNLKSEIGIYKHTSDEWQNSSLNKENLNNTFLNKFEKDWQNKIATYEWIVGGNSYDNINTTPAISYQNEIVNPATDKIDLKQIGLMYVSDYLFSAKPIFWNHLPNGNSEAITYKEAINDNWMFNGLYEWTITYRNSASDAHYLIHYGGEVTAYNYESSLAIRPCFYLTPEITLIGGTGAQNDPYRIS